MDPIIMASYIDLVILYIVYTPNKRYVKGLMCFKYNNKLKINVHPLIGILFYYVITSFLLPCLPKCQLV